MPAPLVPDPLAEVVVWGGCVIEVLVPTVANVLRINQDEMGALLLFLLFLVW